MNYKLAYFDASHSNSVEENVIDTFTFHHKGIAEISIKIGSE